MNTFFEEKLKGKRKCRQLTKMLSPLAHMFFLDVLNTYRLVGSDDR